MDISSLKEILSIITGCIVLALVISILLILFKRRYSESYMGYETDNVEKDHDISIREKLKDKDETFKLGEEFKKPIILGDAVRMFTKNYEKEKLRLKR